MVNIRQNWPILPCFKLFREEKRTGFSAKNDLKKVKDLLQLKIAYWASITRAAINNIVSQLSRIC